MTSKLSDEEFVLLLINANDKKEINGKLCFQKEMFIVDKEICIDLNFEPYQFGPYS